MKNNLIYFFKIFFAILIVSVLLDKIAYYALNAISDKVYTGQGVGKLNHFLFKNLVNALAYPVFKFTKNGSVNS